MLEVTLLTLLVADAATDAGAPPRGPFTSLLPPHATVGAPRDGDELATPAERELGEPSVSGINPNRVFLERSIDVAISGDDTGWTDAVAVDFGDGITVNSVHLASPTSIVANLTIDRRAEVGVRDVVVREGETEVVYTGAFKVESPLARTSMRGTLASGSIVVGTLAQRDLSTPFDAVNTVLTTNNPAIHTDYVAANLYNLDFTLLIDVPVTTGGYDLTVVSGLEGSQVTSSLPGGLPIVSRAPIPLVEGDNAGTLVDPFGTRLYSFTPPDEPTRTTFVATTDNAAASPIIAVLPSSGSFAELIGVDSTVTANTTAATPLYVVYWDAWGAGEQGININVTTAGPPPPETEPNDDCAHAMRIAASSTTAGALRDASDVDWYVFPATAEDVGKVVHVRTQPGDPTTDTVVEVFGSDCTTSLGGPSPDFAYHEDFYSTPILAAGDVYVKVTPSSAAFTTPNYELVVGIE
ncbi:hypothetical protein [Nannocystis sp. SCPEA4]|uniref:hypothetical protein n=1 Tax=Nannocystis sp. SCPEA4 TaxID=2996787 RepID=UPI00226F55E5|nr:hypothetical protein [Nannocystis sp. SCPEA4]MCY1054545.1 hypothetical protein [Nannocystis sp. SCPEA4]